jgi:hypothetical protein
VVSAVLLVCAIAGVTAGLLCFSAEWALLRRVAGGAVSGAGVGLLISFSKTY